MKVILKLENDSRENIFRTIEHFVAHGFFEFVVFLKIPQRIFTLKDLYYFNANGIKLSCINKLDKEGVGEELLKISGSLKEQFFIVYSSDACEIDLDELLSLYFEEKRIALLGNYNERCVVGFFECEILDYILPNKNFEKEILERVGQDGEISIFNGSK